jgi:8-oxo-dGTP pyrophosphatase MutT (NUDIX family)
MFSSLEDFAWRTIYRVIFPLAQIWWLIRKKRHEGALVATYVGPDLLLLRSSYRRAWNFPGGGVKRFETPEQAARREFQEETGLIVPPLQPKGSVEGFWECRRDKVHFFELHLDRMPPIKIDNREIVEIRLVPPAALAAMPLTGAVSAFVRGELKTAGSGDLFEERGSSAGEPEKPL